MNRVAKHRQSIGGQNFNLEYIYNLAGQLTSEKYPSGKIVNIGYDANGRLSSVADAQRIYLSSISFGSRTLPSQINFGNGTNQAFAFNDRLQMTSQELKRGAEVVQKYDYGFGQIDVNGNLDTTKNNGQLAKVESYIGANKQWTQKFSYDSIGRLSESKEYRGDTNALTYKQKFDFDRFGNLYRKNASNPTSGQESPLPYTPIEDTDISKSTNRFTAATGTTYNDAGQVIADSKFRAMSFGYDANGRMVKATRANVPDALSVYDSLGNRVAQKVQDVWQFVIYDAFGKLVAEYGGITATDEGGVKYLLSDWQGSVRAVLSNAGFVQSRTDYQSFGEEIQSGVGLRTGAQGFGGGINTKQGYGLTEKDDSTGLNHTWFRKNENRAGRWTSPDPYNGSMSLANPQSFNRYSYVENEPTNFIDPSGLLMSLPRTSGSSFGTGVIFAEVFIYISWFDQYWDNHFDLSIGGTEPWGGGGTRDPETRGGGNGGGGTGGGDNELFPNIKKIIEDGKKRKKEREECIKRAQEKYASEVTSRTYLPWNAEVAKAVVAGSLIGGGTGAIKTPPAGGGRGTGSWQGALATSATTYLGIVYREAVAPNAKSSQDFTKAVKNCGGNPNYTSAESGEMTPDEIYKARNYIRY
jgi:RHS repeat-associated protein